MKLDVAVNEAVLSNVGTTGEFRIRNSAKAFKILSDGLYSNKIRAIIRELSCNAVDSHVAAGKGNIPFEVHLPTMLEPWFSVRDFGLGLDGNQVTNIYTTYFESTKTDSNDYIGALGLGSKSPFSYTENFTVTAIKDGIKRIYSAFINEAGIPCVAEMTEELTDEGNGVEVKFSVTDRSDYHSFQNEARTVFKWFKNKPTITGVPDLVINGPDYVEKNIVPGVHYATGTSMAIMGNIAYPLSKFPEAPKHLEGLEYLLDCGLAMEFDIGELDFAASREELSYVPVTIKSIKAKLTLLNDNLVGHLSAKADAIPNLWDRALFLYAENSKKLYKSAVKKYVTDTKFPLFSTASHSYNGKYDFKLGVKDLATRGIRIDAFSFRYSTAKKYTTGSEYVNNTYMPTWSIPVDSDVIFVLNDLKTGCAARAKYHFAKNNTGHTYVFCVSHDSEDQSIRKAAYDKFMAELKNPPKVVMASTLDKAPAVKRTVSNQGIAVMTKADNNGRRNAKSYTWSPVHEQIDPNETYYFVCLNGHEPIDKNGNPFLGIDSIRHQMDDCGVPEISGIKIYGVRKNRIKEISELDNWVWFEDKIKEEIGKITDKHVGTLVVVEMFDNHYNNRALISKNAAKLIDPKSPYAEFVKVYSSMPRASGYVTTLVQLCSKYGKTVQVDVVKKKMNDDKAFIQQKYPLLKFLQNADAAEVASYINLVDKS